MRTFVASAFVFGLLASSAAQASNLVQNGSFEALTGPFVNSGSNYMQLGAGSTELSGWSVSSSSGHIVLALSPTGDGHTASDGNYFVDLSGFGAESPDGAVSQTISTVGGASYAFSMDLGTANTGTVFASVGGTTLALSAGASFVVGGTSWTRWSGTFTGDALDHAPVLTIGDASPGSQIDFVDNVSIVETAGAAPEPAAWALMMIGVGGMGAALRTRRRKLAA